MTKFCRLRQGEGYEACDDESEAAPLWGRDKETTFG